MVNSPLTDQINREDLETGSIEWIHTETHTDESTSFFSDL